MPVTRNLPRSAVMPCRRPAWRRAAIASGALVAFTLLSVGCGGSQTYIKQIQHLPGHSASQIAQTHTT